MSRANAGSIRLSVIVPTHNRPDKLVETLSCLQQQDLAGADYEVIVVDDGSNPPVRLPDRFARPAFTLVRLNGLGRSAARNKGAAIAKGGLLVFLDDDMKAPANFLASHLRAHGEWPDALLVGAVRLPVEAVSKPFGRFRQRLEDQTAPRVPGLVSVRNFCTAANMSISRDLFYKLGGFDSQIQSGEDQDFALRHTAANGRIAFVPEAETVHRDSALDARSYCQRAEWGMREILPFCYRHPDWPDNIERERVNGLIQLGREPIALSAYKLFKKAVGFRPFTSVLFFIAALLERVAPRSLALDKSYRLLLGVYIFRGYRTGLKKYGGRAEPGQSPSQSVATGRAMF
jgi:GT2 family glycosyltransferase